MIPQVFYLLSVSICFYNEVIEVVWRRQTICVMGMGLIEEAIMKGLLVLLHAIGSANQKSSFRIFPLTTEN